MNEIKKIHLGRQPFTISVEAHKLLREYLDEIEKQVGIKSEVLKEIESRMAELLIERGVKGDKVVLAEDVKFLKDQLGDPNDFKDESAEPSVHEPAQPHKRLFRDPQGAYIAGVCSGLATFIGIDATIVRLAFVLATFFGGAGIPLYIVLWLVIPEVKTPSDRLQMQGKSVTVDSLKDLVERADVKGAAERAGKTVGPIIERFAQVVGTIVGTIIILIAASLFAGLTCALTYLFFHHNALIADTIPFPLGRTETVFTAMGAAAVVLVSLLILLLGVATVRHKTVIPGWIVAALFGLLLLVGAVGTAAGPDTVNNVRHRYESAQRLELHTVDKFSSVEISGSDADFVYEYSNDYQVGTRYLGKGNPGELKYSVKNGVLKVDASNIKSRDMCDGFCASTGQIDEVIIRAPKLDNITANGNRISGETPRPNLPPAVPIPVGRHFTVNGYDY
jgi:phage shock protein PspC (stress-responsive transcriptional regulator)